MTSTSLLFFIVSKKTGNLTSMIKQDFNTIKSNTEYSKIKHLALKKAAM
ncbi:hypothetical protein [Cytobacillus purgationiresistens]|uniref:Uncharacterized protein n=1 Tax=Cytobacillus purgationiresistens TaxID=863449 RepID=A0ABU0AP10_9BACI|nr:hypothetical protein [Cytobacillus purgationiresistens]MDQ0273027.1 hypothetical protein [Cytobacillus purgationiresistens]